MNEKPFVHLHFHTAYSLLDGACRVRDVVNMAAQHNMPALAITDHGVMYGAIDFYKQATDKGIKPILGCEVYVAKGCRFDKGGADGAKSHNNHLVLLAENETGYRNLMQIVSAAHLEGYYYKPRCDKALLAEKHEGLIALSACLKGEVNYKLAHDDFDGALRAAGEFSDIFGPDRFFLEVQDHGIAEQHKVNRQLGELARRANLRIVATNDVHYMLKDHAAAHEVLLCMQTGATMSDTKRMRYQSQEFYMKTRGELEFLDLEFPGALDLTVEIADRCKLELDFKTLHFPAFAVPEGRDPQQYLVEVAHAGLRRLYHIADPAHPADERERAIMARFDKEIHVIATTHFINYFLVVWDFIRHAKEKGIPVGPGRGSGGGSVVAYALGITTLDPLRYNLVFERFLNPERISPPDFDIDFCPLRRAEVIDYVKERYGRERVAQIITFGSLGAKAVIKDVGRVLEMDFKSCERLTKMVPDDPKIKLTDAFEKNPDFKAAYDNEPESRRLLDYALVLEGLYRHEGMHAAGVVIGDQPLIEIVPLSRDKRNNEPITQYSMEPLGAIGLLKMDFLGLQTLTIINEAVALIQRRHGVTIDPEALPLDDAKTFAMLSRAETVGVFQVESEGMRKLLRDVGIGCLEDIIAVIALFRPGPIEMLPAYTARKTGKMPVTYDHPLLEPILKDTYGVMVYQEQVQQAANILAGYSLGEADMLRRAMGKKKKEEMQKHRAIFVEGCLRLHNIEAKQAGQIFDTMAEFAGYGFNKAHSAAYGIVTYQTAYLKANYPAEFMASLLSNAAGDFDKIPGFIAEAQSMDLKVLPPDINTSAVRFAPGDDGIRYALAGIKNVGEGAAQAIVAERERGGPYQGLVDFCARLDGKQINRRVIESLVRAGAFDFTRQHRARLFNGIETAMARAASVARDRRSGQGSLFGLLDAGAPVVADGEDLPDAPVWPPADCAAAEKELLGTYMTGHPMMPHAATLRRFALMTTEQFRQAKGEINTRLGGMLTQVARRFTKAQKPMLSATIEDLSGAARIVVFAETLATYGHLLQPDAPVLICGSSSDRGTETEMIVNEVYSLAEAGDKFAQRVQLIVPVDEQTPTRLERIKALIAAHPGPCALQICMRFPGGEQVHMDASAKLHVRLNAELLSELDACLGERNVIVTVKREVYLKPRKPRGPFPPRNGQGRE